MTGRFVLASFAALVVAGRVLWEGRADRTGGERPAPMEPLMLPVCILLLVLLPLFTGRRDAAESLIRLFALLVICLSVYFSVLLCLLPLLRRYISARSCALLWVLPNFLYLTGSLSSLSRSDRPKWLLTLPAAQVQRVLLLIWLAGFVAVLAGQILSHLLFRRRLLASATPVEDPAIRARWVGAWRSVDDREPIPVVRSREARTPLTVGCFRSTMVLVLPEADYAPEELELIFRHEVRHIRRLDMRTKAFLAFCTALCWFCPLMWLARRKAAEDLELCCDEEVLRDADGETRRRYAELLLRTAGDSRGFSTCLSAGAAGLRYRLKNVVEPRRKGSGALCAGLAILLLLMGSGAVAFAKQPGTAAEEIFSRFPEGSAVTALGAGWLTEKGESYRELRGWQEEPLMACLSGLTVQQVYSTQYLTSEDGRWLVLTLGDGETTAGYLRVGRTVWTVSVPNEYGVRETMYFLLKDEPDQAYLESVPEL